MARNSAHGRKLKAVPSRRESERGGVDRLLSGRVPEKKPARRASRKKKPTETLPGDFAKIADLFVAGRKVEKEIEFKIRYAERRVKDFCLKRFAEIFARSGRRPPSIDYEGEKSRFTFIQTARINMTHDKVEALREMGFPVDEITELKGLRINYEALQRHKLEGKLRQALEEMNVAEDTLEEIFEPIVQLKESFFDTLASWVSRALPGKKDITESLYEVLSILQPANQVRNADVPGMSAEECFELVEKAEIEPEAEEDLSAA